MSEYTKEAIERKPFFHRIVTHEEAHDAFMKYHNALFNRGPRPSMHVPAQSDDPDMVVGDYIRQQKERDAVLEGLKLIATNASE